MKIAPKLIIFDFDGVVADSEVLANEALAQYLTELGRPTTFEDSLREFMGKRHEDMLARVDVWLGRPRPVSFSEDYRERTRGMMREMVQPIPQVATFLDGQKHVAKCVASSSQRGWLDHCVDKFAFRDHFADNLFSATEVQNGKPAPDIFLLAADRMGVATETCVVIEDSPTGVLGARAANMTTIGFLGGSHVRDGHRAKLEAAGASFIAEDYAAVAKILSRFG
jgi:HAD superfamily hydrolase (TIGR01509 family)